MILDFTTTAVARPDIVNRTYKSFYRNLRGVDFDKCTLYINIDPLPSDVDRQKVIDVAEKYFGKVVARCPDKANYTAAYNWCWKSATEEYVFNLEDDWILKRSVSVKELIKFFNKHDGLYEAAFRAYPYRYDKAPTSPAVLHRRYYSAIGGNLDESLNPEVQLRGKKFGLEMPTPEFNISAKGKVIAWPDEEIIVEDIGREWIENTKFKRPDKKARFTSWVT